MVSRTHEPPPFGRSVPGNRWDLLDGEPGVAGIQRTVSVIVVHYRQQAELDRTLASLARQTYPAELLEVIVVDDSSPEPPIVPAGVTLVRQELDGFHLSAARNLGVLAATGELLCFLDADTAPEPEYVERMSRLPSLAPEAVTVGRRRHAQLSGVASHEAIETSAPARELPSPRWLLDAYESSGNLLDADDRSYRYLIGAVTCCSRWFFDRVGGFDESFTEYGGEDWEWAHRAWLAGAIVAHIPDAVAWHDGPDWAGRAAEGDDGGAGGEAGSGEIADRAALAAAQQAQKNRESMRVAQSIRVAGSRGRGLRARTTDVTIRVSDASAWSLASLWLTIDSLLEALPDSTVVLPLDDHDVFTPFFSGDPRVTRDEPGHASRVEVVVARPMRVTDAAASAALVDATAAVGNGALGAVEFAGADGSHLLTITSSRAIARRSRWALRDGELFETRRTTVPGLTALTGEPSIAAHLGGWA